MDRIWAPWRMAYIDAPKLEGCVFCAQPAENDDRQNLILHRGKTCFIVMNLFPYNNSHLMVTPYRHTSDFTTLQPDESAEMMQLTQYCVRLLGHAIRPDGFNVGLNLGTAAGAGIAEHLHTHIVPRWNGDTNFMPVLGDTKVLPDALWPGYDRLRAAMERTPPPDP